MSSDTLGFLTLGSDHVSSLHEPQHEVHRRSCLGALRQNDSSDACASPSSSPSASPCVFTVSGKSMSNTGHNSRHRTRHRKDSSNSSFMSNGDVGAGGSRRGECPPTRSSGVSSCVLPSTAASLHFTMRGVSCSTRLSNAEAAAAAVACPAVAAGASPSPSPCSNTQPRAAPSSPSYAKPRFNNYVMGQSAPMAPLRSSAPSRTAANQPPSRVPAAAAAAASTPMKCAAPASAALGTSPSFARASSYATSPIAHSGERNGAHSCWSEAQVKAAPPTRGGEVPASAEKVNTSSATVFHSPRVSTVFAPEPVRPLLRCPTSSSNGNANTALRTTAASKQETTSSTLNTGSNSAAKDHTSTSPKAANGTMRRPHIPILQMTRTFALRRPVLLTKDASTTATTAATPGGRRCRPCANRSSAPREEKPEAPLATRPADLPDRRVPSSPSLSGASFPAYAPTPPRAVSNQPRRSRRPSLSSTTSNVSATGHQYLRSLHEEAAATHLFFPSTPSFADAQLDRARSYTANTGNGAASCNAVTPSPNASAAVSPVNVHGGAAVKREGDGSLASGEGPGSSRANSLPHRGGSEAQRRGSFRSFHGTSNPSYNVVERLREKGNQHMMREEFAQAIAAYSEGIRLAPSSDAVWRNRAAALLLTFRYLPAVADCLYVLSIKPGSVKAHWRAARAYAAAYRFLDAKKYYLLAQQGCMKERNQSTSMSSSGVNLTNGGSIDGSGSFSAGKGRTGSGNDAADRGKPDGAAKEYQAIAAEAAAIEMVEHYWQHVRAERWSDAVAVVDKILATARYTGPTAVSWQALRLEALLRMQPKTVLAEAESLHRAFPDALELYHVLAKALFYTVHDAASTTKCLKLLDEAAAKRSTQNTMLNVHVRYAVRQLREGAAGEGGSTAAAQLEAWARRNQLREDSRVAELRHTIDKFARRRDSGNSAYEKGNWDAAVAAYTQCLQTDCLNHALLAAVYCNRTAAYMQAGRWREALSDADKAIQLSPQLATAYGRRGRIQLYLLAQEYEAQRALLARHFTSPWSTAVKAQLIRYADAAVTDLTRAVELLPTAELKNQLGQALAQRQIVREALSWAPAGDTQHGGAFSSSAYGTFPRAGGSSNGGSAYQRTYSNSRPASSTSPCSVLQQELQLLGVSRSVAAAGGLPDFKVIVKAYRESALRWHPDKWITSSPQEQQAAERQFKLISIAYTSLRERYAAESVAS